MAIESNLIHSGLPWTAPQKIMISSSQYINNITINRGLLNLLNNDYYLQIKTAAINNYIQQNVISHIFNQDLHVSWSRIESILEKINIATQDAIYYVPVTYNNVPLTYSAINTIISKIPKNLNGHTIVLYFCHAVSTNTTSINASIKDKIDLENNGLSFQNFIAGQLVLFSNTNKKIVLPNQSDISILYNLQAKEDEAQKIFSNIQAFLNNDSLDTMPQALTISSTGLNKSFSTLSFINCQANIYMVNLKIENTLKNSDWDNISTTIAEITALPAKNYLLNFYSCSVVENSKILYNNEYLNTDFLYNNLEYSLYCNGGAIAASDITSTGISINSPAYRNSINVIPQYFTFDAIIDQSQLTTNEIRKYIYDWNDKKQNFTITFIGCLSGQLANYTNSPIFSDYNLDTDNGLYVYLNKIYKSSVATSSDIAEYYTSFQQNYNNIIDKFGLYAIQFVHNAQGEGNTLLSAFQNIQIQPNKMRVNVLFYPFNASASPRILSPNSTTIKYVNESHTGAQLSAYLNTVNYEFNKIKQSDITVDHSLKLFAHHRINSHASLSCWDYYSGKVKNICLFRKILTHQQLKALALQQFEDSYQLLTGAEKTTVKSITKESYVGALYLKNNNNVNFIKSTVVING